MPSRRLALAACTVLVAASLAFASRADTERTVYVAGVDAKGNALDELIADDLSVTVGGQPRPIMKLVPARDPKAARFGLPAQWTSANAFLRLIMLQLISIPLNTTSGP